MIKGVLITKLKVINTPGGNVMQAMKETSPGFEGFGEAYFSQVDKGFIKAWKRHSKMTLNLIVPLGEIRFVLFDDRKLSKAKLQEVVISKDSYHRLTIPPKIWVGFQGLSDGTSMLLNIANIEHNQNEVDKRSIEDIEFNWGN
jgi:dTDP-4-dehydrorhamnose 3,5-epimerase